MNRTLRSTLLSASLLAALTGCGAPSGTTPAAPPLRHPAGFVVAPQAVPTPPRTVGRPTRLVIPVIGVDETLHAVGLRADGAMQTPDFGDAGWYDEGPRPGGAGPAVLVAHVHGPAGDDVFARLRELRPGDRVRVLDTRGTSVFVVTSSEQVRKEALPYDRIWPRTATPLLRLITCGGEPDPVTRVYPDNTVVYARLLTSTPGTGR